MNEIEGFLNRRHDLTKRKEAEILELDEVRKILKILLCIYKLVFQLVMY